MGPAATRPCASSSSRWPPSRISLLVLTALVELAGLPKILAQAIAVVAGLPVNFLGQKLWSFAS